MMTYEEIIFEIKAQKNPVNIAGMARFGINVTENNAYGLGAVKVKALAKKIDKDHELAQKLWKTPIHEAKLLAALVDNSKWVTESQMDDWIKDIYSWDICDNTCSLLFAKTDLLIPKAIEYSRREPEYEKRTGFSMMAYSATGKKKISNSDYSAFYNEMIEGSTDNRNFVKKAVNWAIRSIGKKNLELNKEMINICNIILAKYSNSNASRWVAKGALRELESEIIQNRLLLKSKKG